MSEINDLKDQLSLALIKLERQKQLNVGYQVVLQSFAMDAAKAELQKKITEEDLYDLIDMEAQFHYSKEITNEDQKELQCLNMINRINLLVGNPPINREDLK